MNVHLCLTRGALLAALSLLLTTAPWAENPPGEQPALGTVRVSQQQIEDGTMTQDEIRQAGLRMFATSFNKLDGYGDGPMDLSDTVSPGGRPTLQGNGTFLRVNGLDAQSCLDCHSIISNASMPPKLGIGGAGAFTANAMIMATAIDPADLDDLDGAAGFNGRVSNPPFTYGAGGVELLSLEMTEDLHALKRQAISNPGVVVQLMSKGVHFGSLVADASGNLDLSQVDGVDTDLVVKPFGRKGEVTTVRDFAIGAMQFHFGMQPVEVVGEGIDDDGDGVVDEILVGELSALHIFVATIDRPATKRLTPRGERGFRTFQDIGCSGCHIPELETRSAHLPFRFPADPTDPQINVFYSVDLSKNPTRFEKNREGGIRVPLFADLKRHDMGDALAENFDLADAKRNREFTTARLWGIADSAPYLHDGRATTLTEAILLHGGESQSARDGFADLSDARKEAVLEFLRSLRTPENPLRTMPPPSRGR